MSLSANQSCVLKTRTEHKLSAFCLISRLLFVKLFATCFHQAKLQEFLTLEFDQNCDLIWDLGWNDLWFGVMLWDLICDLAYRFKSFCPKICDLALRFDLRFACHLVFTGISRVYFCRFFYSDHSILCVSFWLVKCFLRDIILLFNSLYVEYFNTNRPRKNVIYLYYYLALWGGYNNPIWWHLD